MLPAPRRSEDPFTLSAYRSGFDRLLEDFFGGRWQPWAVAPSVPAMDVRETDSAFLVDVELPGLRAEDIQVKAEDGVLHISGERSEKRDEKVKNMHRSERYYGRIERSLALPASVDGQNVEASYADGVLHVTLPKKAGAKPRTIPVKGN